MGLFDSDLNSDDLEIWFTDQVPAYRGRLFRGEPEGSLDSSSRIHSFISTHITTRAVAFVILTWKAGSVLRRFYLWVLEKVIFHRFHLLVLDPEPRPDDEIQNRAED